MTLVWVAFLLGTGVLFGMGALVVDLGYGMVQVRAMQNGADAGAIAAAKLLAGRVGKDTTGRVVYLSVVDGDVHARALQFVQANRPNQPAGPASPYSTAVEYRPCPDQTRPAGAANFTFNSDPAIVTGAAGVRQLSGTASVPNWTCSVRVHARATYTSFFGGALGRPTQAAVARGSARIYPTDRPKSVTGVWPITRWIGADNGCRVDLTRPSQPCVFWDSNAQPGGEFKNLVDLSRYSGIWRTAGVTREQRFHCQVPLGQVCWDTTHPGNNDKINDPPVWTANGWRGHLWVDETDANCQIASHACGNSRLEVFSGTLGNNIGSAMQTYINNNYEGTDPVLGRFVTLPVFLWQYGETDPFNTTTNTGNLWTSGPNGNPIRRVIVKEVRRYIFYYSTVTNSSVAGYFTAFEANTPPREGPPSDIANTVALSE